MDNVTIITASLVAPRDLKEGEEFIMDIEIPKKERKTRGQLAGLELADMTDAQLKIEIINANSVLYKAKQRGADVETIARNEARVEAAKAEKVRRTPIVEQATAIEDIDPESVSADPEVSDEI